MVANITSADVTLDTDGRDRSFKQKSFIYPEIPSAKPGLQIQLDPSVVTDHLRVFYTTTVITVGNSKTK